jgi:CRISPR-associated protein Cmr3
VTIKAVACGRHQIISGWDLKHTEKRDGRTINGRPKPTRRLVPAGSVYFVSFSLNDAQLEPRQALASWLERVWLHNISDHAQDRRDGFGLAAVGVWDGQSRPLEVKP